MNFFFDTATKIGTTLLPINVVRLNTIRSVLCEKRTIKGWNSRDFFSRFSRALYPSSQVLYQIPRVLFSVSSTPAPVWISPASKVLASSTASPSWTEPPTVSFHYYILCWGCIFFFGFAKENAPVKCKLWKLSKGFK